MCIAPLLLVLSAWWLPFTPETADSWLHVSENLLNSYILQTLWLCLGVATICGFFGVTAAWLTSQFSFTGRRWLEWGMILPLAVPAYISAYSYGWLFEYAGPVQTLLRDWMGWSSRGDYWFPQFRSLGGAMWVLGISTTPYVYLLARTAFLSQPREWWEAAATLGTYPARFFRKIALPAARPFIATGIALSLMETIADIGTVTVLGVQTVSAGIYRSWFFMSEPLVAARLAGLLLIFVFVLMGVEALGRRGMRYSSLRQHQQKDLVRLHGGQNVLAVMACALPVIAGFLLPVGILLRLVSYSTSWGFMESLSEYLWQSVRLGGFTGVLAVTAAFVMVCAERFHAQWLRLVTLLANLGYAIPGAVVAVGLMMLFGWLRESTGSTFIITGSIAGLLIAYTVRFMATAYSPLHSGMLRIPEEMDMAAASLGKGKAKTIFLVHVPLLMLSLCTAFIVVFLDTVKELPATLILRPFDVKTLAVAAFEFSSDDRYIEAAPYSLVLIAMSTVAVILLHWVQKRSLEWRDVEH
ncbi:ABC transporter permease [Bdellovibrio bacteriovorus]|uniref:ABC transporter permease n=1 Tax=Bdellovibrio bacteriovorus TaxID=959 RepID=UPI00130D95A1|nr:iron ABC transporter permease [Bdellovibrio bacteriovorus]